MSDSSARSFVVIMIVVALAAVVLRFAVLQVIRFNIEQNESNALETLQFVTTALENYANDHARAYPTDLALLVKNDPPYISHDYISLTSRKGYSFSCMRLEPSGYTCSAVPVQCDVSGRKVFIVTTGQSVAVEECGKKE